jgi:hypothetical protein
MCRLCIAKEGEQLARIKPRGIANELLPQHRPTLFRPTIQATAVGSVLNQSHETVLGQVHGAVMQ